MNHYRITLRGPVGKTTTPIYAATIVEAATVAASIYSGTDIEIVSVVLVD